MKKWLSAFLLPLLLLCGCSSKTTSGGTGDGADGGEGDPPAQVPGGEDPSKFEEPDLTPGPSACAGLAHASIPTPPPAWDAFECVNPIPSNPCTLTGTQSRAYTMCFYAGAGGGETCPGGGCPCGELGLSCVERTVVDERGCDLTLPPAPLSAGPWGACIPPSETPCDATGTQTRLELTCSGGQPVEMTSAPQACDTELEGSVLAEGTFEPTCEFLFETADRTLCPTLETESACSERLDLCTWSGTACGHTGSTEPDRCVQSIAQERPLEVCSGGVAVTTSDSRQCTRSTDGLSFDNSDTLPCEPVDIDDCFSTGERADVQVSSCQGGVASMAAETLSCELAPYTTGSYTMSSLADFKRLVEIGRPEGTDVHSYGLTIRVADFSTDVVACRLTRIDGDLLITGGSQQRIELSGLVEITGDVNISGGPNTRVALPALRSIGGHLQVSGLDWENLDLRSLQEVGSPDAPIEGWVDLSNGVGQLMELPVLALVHGDLTVTYNSDLLRFDLPGLSEVAGDFTIRHNDQLRAFEASNLATIGGVLRIGGLALRVCDAFAYVSVLSSRDALGTPCSLGENGIDVYASDPALPACVYFAELNRAAAGTPYVANRSKLDHDADFVVEACDNCPGVPNADQLDSNNNGIGDECEPP